MKALAWVALVTMSIGSAMAQSPQSGQPAQPSPAASRGGEPKVERTVIDDGRARIEELRVRGQLQKVTVVPLGRAPSYEIITGDGSRDLGEGANTSRGATGKRVWNVLKF